MSNPEQFVLLPLEREAIGLLLAGDLPILVFLRKQAESIVAVKREFTPVGFFTNLEFDDVTPIPGAPNFVIGDVSGHIEGTLHGAMFLLFIKSGKLDCLECTTFGDDKWPKELNQYSLGYANGKRDWIALGKTLPALPTT